MSTLTSVKISDSALHIVAAAGVEVVLGYIGRRSMRTFPWTGCCRLIEATA